jgi:hypothetical protein
LKYKNKKFVLLMEGYIYHLRNDAMPGLAKLGFCKNVLLECNRVQQVYLWCLTVFVLKVKIWDKQNLIFSDLAQYRFNPNREFFKVDDFVIKPLW